MRNAIVLALLFVSLPATAALAQVPPAGMPEGPPPPVIVVAFLGFSETQATQFRQLLEGREQAARDLGQQLAARQQGLEDLLNAATPDAAAIGRAMLELRALHQQAGQIARSFRQGFVELLTPEQRERFGQVEQAAQLLPAVTAFVAMQLIAPPRFPPPPQ